MVEIQWVFSYTSINLHVWALLKGFCPHKDLSASNIRTFSDTKLIPFTTIILHHLYHKIMLIISAFSLKFEVWREKMNITAQSKSSLQAISLKKNKYLLRHTHALLPRSSIKCRIRQWPGVPLIAHNSCRLYIWRLMVCSPHNCLLGFLILSLYNSKHVLGPFWILPNFHAPWITLLGTLHYVYKGGKAISPTTMELNSSPLDTVCSSKASTSWI